MSIEIILAVVISKSNNNILVDPNSEKAPLTHKVEEDREEPMKDETDKIVAYLHGLSWVS